MGRREKSDRGREGRKLIPLSMTIMREESIIVLSRWAIVRIVALLNSVLMVFWMNASVCVSTLYQLS